jgi:hypothetical protein
MDEKHARLAEEINEQVRRVEAEENTELCERLYLFYPDGKGFTMDEKHARLAEEINEQVRRVEAEENTELCERLYLFYPATSRFIAAQ